ncbi:nucleolar complex protein 14 [Tieghemiomyces parasiticus]|uniref:Nucleolar complex protein 14 n=1 Tax=Tieghemiomyces parasiticus TaxID=78921 RepID=A0A9W8E0Q5_9FUNG|nr:nucleolar complex protein 14 [Tieghemiomyces parasiticus]
MGKLKVKKRSAAAEPEKPKNEITITSHGKIRSFVQYALKLLQSTNPVYTEVVVVAEGKGTIRGITVSELIRRHHPGLHQYTVLTDRVRRSIPVAEVKAAANPFAMEASLPSQPGLAGSAATPPKPEPQEKRIVPELRIYLCLGNMGLPAPPKSNQSALKRLRSTIKDAGLAQGSNKIKKKGKFKGKGSAAASEQSAHARKARLEAISNMFNPFETKVNRGAKTKVLGRKLKGETGRPSVSKQAGIDNRKKTILVEWQNRNRSGGLIDRRFGENNPHLTPEEKMMERFTREQQKSLRNAESFNLEDEEELTHMGQSLADIDDFNEEGLRPSDDEEMDPDGAIDKRTVLHAHFGGFGANEESPMENHQHKKSKQEVMRELIAKSKQHKADRQMQKEEDDEMRAELDEDLKDIHGLLLSGRAVEGEGMTPAATGQFGSAPLADQDTDYNTYLLDLARERRALPSDRLKTEEEVLMEAKAQLERAERHRQRRMVGEPSDTEPEDGSSSSDSDSDGEDGKKSRKRRRLERAQAAKRRAPQGDDLSDDYEDEDEDDKTHMTFTVSKGLQLRNAKGQVVEQDSSDESEDESDEEDSDVEGDSDLNADGSDLESSDDEEPARRRPSAAIDQDGFSDDSDNDDGDAPAKSQVKSAIVPAAGPRRFTGTPVPPKSKDDALPFTFPAPETYEDLADLLEGWSLEQQATILDRLRTLYHVQLDPKNKQRLQNLLRALYVHVHTLASDPPTATSDASAPSLVKTMNVFIRHLTELAPIYPEVVGELAREQLRNFHEELTTRLQNRANGKGEDDGDVFPETTDLIQFKLIAQIMSASDLQHPVVTPMQLVMAQYLQQYPVRHPADVKAGLFMCYLLIDMQKLARRFVPEVYNYLVSVLHAFYDPVIIEAEADGGDEAQLVTSQSKQQAEVRSSDRFLYPKISAATRNLAFLRMDLDGETTWANVELRKLRPFGDVAEEEKADDTDKTATTPAVSRATRVALLGTTVQILSRAAQTWAGLPSYPELFGPLVDYLRAFPVSLLHTTTLRPHLDTLRSKLDAQLAQALRTRRRTPLQLQKHKAIAIPSYAPRFHENYSLDRHYNNSGDRAFAERQKLTRQVKKEARGAAREIRKDTNFIQTERIREVKEKDEAYKQHIKKVMGSLHSQREEFTQLDNVRIKDKRKKRLQR